MVETTPLCYRCNSNYRVFEVEPGVNVCQGRCLKLHKEIMKKREEPSAVNGKGDGDDEKWTVGKHCRAVYSEDGLWYEGEIVSMNTDEASGSQYGVVKFCGYGNEESVWVSDLEPSKGEEARQQQIRESQGEQAATQQVEEVVPEEPPKKEEKAVEWKVGDQCRAMYSADGIIYEADIKEMIKDEESGNEYATVVFVGYMNEENIWLTDLLPSDGQAAREQQSKEANAVEGEAAPEDVTDSGPPKGETAAEPEDIARPPVEEEPKAIVDPSPPVEDVEPKPPVEDALPATQESVKSPVQEEKQTEGDFCSVPIEGIVQNVEGDFLDVKFVGGNHATKISAKKVGRSLGREERLNQSLYRIAGDPNDRIIKEKEATIQNLRRQIDLLGKSNMELKRNQVSTGNEKQSKVDEMLAKSVADSKRLITKCEVLEKDSAGKSLEITKLTTELTKLSTKCEGQEKEIAKLKAAMLDKEASESKKKSTPDESFVDEISRHSTPTKSHLDSVPQNAMMVPMYFPGAVGQQVVFMPMVACGGGMVPFPQVNKDGNANLTHQPENGPIKGQPLRQPNM